MKYAILETNHTPTLIFCSSREKQKTKRIITPLSEVTRYISLKNLSETRLASPKSWSLCSRNKASLTKSWSLCFGQSKASFAKSWYFCSGENRASFTISVSFNFAWSWLYIPRCILSLIKNFEFSATTSTCFASSFVSATEGTDLIISLGLKGLSALIEL